MQSMLETLKIISDSNYNSWTSEMSQESINIIKNKIDEIPSEYFEPKFKAEGIEENSISLIQFSMKTVGMSPEAKDGLMERYHINPYDMSKLQGIVDNIRVVSEYGSTKEEKKNIAKSNGKYGIALADKTNLDKAYPLWIAYLYADSKDPLSDVKSRLKADGVEGKYDPYYIVDLIEHTNSIMSDKSGGEKKDLLISSISDILEDGFEMPVKKDKDEIEM